MKKRPLRPRETKALTVAPLAITDLTCAAVCGLEPRQWREWLVEASVPHSHIGRRTIARADHVLAALSEASAASPSDPIPTRADEDEALTAEAILASLGLKRSA